MTAMLIDLPPRGLSLLHACLPQARKQVDAISDIAIASCLQRPAVNILCSGDFGWDADYISTLVQKYSQDGRTPHVLFYLTNGPVARHWKTMQMKGYGSALPPEQFRQKIMTDKTFQNGFQELARRLADIVKEIHQLGGQAYMVPQLEDNQSNESFAMMLKLTRAAMPQDLPIHFGRNPCVSCYPGNEGGLPAGCFLEEHHHSASTAFTVENGIVSNDGCAYAFPGETPAFRPCLPLEKFIGVQSKTGQMNSIFLLLSTKYQGLVNQSTIPPPEKRVYVMPTEAEKSALIEFLLKP
ncbi:MAG: hypothetical protein Q8R88_16885 [Desulfoprunum sp.]|nr:hypothetical protein [Desulfoprunum sp.]